jgi:hypothetical protein
LERDQQSTIFIANWSEWSDDSLLSALANIGKYGSADQEAIRGEDLKRTRTCPNCGLLTPLTTDECDCGFSFVARKGGDETRNRLAKQMFWLWVGAFFALRYGTIAQFRERVEWNDVAGAITTVALPLVFLFPAALLKFRASRWSRVHRSGQWLYFLPCILPFVIAAFILTDLRPTRTRGPNQPPPMELTEASCLIAAPGALTARTVPEGATQNASSAHLYQTEVGSETYSLLYAHYPAEVLAGKPLKETAKPMVEAFATYIGGKLEEPREARLDGRSALEYACDSAQTGTYSLLRVCSTGNRLYCVGFTTSFGSETSNNHASQYFESFRITSPP